MAVIDKINRLKNSNLQAAFDALRRVDSSCYSGEDYQVADKIDQLERAVSYLLAWAVEVDQERGQL